MVEPFEIDDDGEVKLLDRRFRSTTSATLIDWAQLTSHRGVAKVAIVIPAEG